MSNSNYGALHNGSSSNSSSSSSSTQAPPPVPVNSEATPLLNTNNSHPNGPIPVPGHDIEAGKNGGDDDYVEHEGQWRSKLQDFVDNNTGLLLIALAQLFFALMNVSVKKLAQIEPDVSPFQLVVFRMGVTYIIVLIYVFAKKIPDPFLGPKGIRLILLGRGFFGFVGLFSVYYALKYLSLSDSTVLSFLTPLTTSATCAVILGEPFTVKQGLAAVTSLIGVVLIARPTFIFHSQPDASTGAPGEVTPAQRLTAVGMALVGVLGSTGAYTSLRSIGRRAHPMHSITSFSLWSLIGSTIGMWLNGDTMVFPERRSWLALLICVGVFGFGAQTLLTMGLARETAARGTLAVYVQIIFAVACEWIFFHTTPSYLSIIGTVIILCSASYVALSKQRAQTPEKKKTADTDAVVPEAERND